MCGGGKWTIMWARVSAIEENRTADLSKENWNEWNDHQESVIIRFYPYQNKRLSKPTTSAVYVLTHIAEMQIYILIGLIFLLSLGLSRSLSFSLSPSSSSLSPSSSSLSRLISHAFFLYISNRDRFPILFIDYPQPMVLRIFGFVWLI